MAYALIDDQFHSHPKVVDLVARPGGYHALGVWLRALSWAHAYTLNEPPDRQGAFTIFTVQSWTGDEDSAHETVEMLTAVGLWLENGDGWIRIHNFRKWARLDEREAKTARAQHAANTRWHPDNADALPLDMPLHGEGNAGAMQTHSGASCSDDANGMTIPKYQVPSTKQQPKSKDLSADADFDRFWAVYPNRKAKAAAREAWDKAVKGTGSRHRDGPTDPQTIIDGAVAYADSRPRYVKHPTTWLNGECWLDDPDDPTPAVIEKGTWL